MIIGYLGPTGTFSQKAALYYANGSEMIPFQTITDVLTATEEGVVNMGVVPIENTTEGTVNATIDSLIFDTNLFIQSQLIMPVSHALMVNKNNKDNKVEKILSHPQALAQCREFLRQNYNEIETVEVSSTAKASEMVSKSNDFIASIGTDLCKDIYNLTIVHNNIQDNDNNKTYFILVSKNDNRIPKLNKKTSIAFSTLNKPGELYRILDIFSLWDINMTKISSRPMKNKEGEYVFFVDFEGFQDEKDAVDALTMIKRKTNLFKILGTYDVITPFEN